MNLIKILSCICLLGIALYAHHANARQPLDKIVAVVNDEVISLSELARYEKVLGSRIRQQGGANLPPKAEWQKQVLNHMITEKIQLQLAKQSGIEIDSLAVTQAIQEMARVQNVSMEEFKHEIEAQGFKFNDYRDFVRVQMTLQNLHAREIGQDITVAKHEVESFLNSAAGQDQSGVEYQLGHILLALPEAPTPQVLQKSQAEAEQLVKDLRSNLDFSKTAMTKSAGRHALDGGDLGWRTAAELPTLFVNYVPEMNVGDIVGPIRTTGGLHIIKLLNKRTKDVQAGLETHVLQIVITPSNTLSSNEAKQLILDLHKQLKNGGDFAKLAQTQSHDIRSANKGGDLGWVTPAVVPESFGTVMQNLKNGELSAPFLTEEGWTLIKVLDRRSQRTSDEAAQHKAMEVLMARKSSEALEAWTKRIRDEAQVEILLPEFKA